MTSSLDQTIADITGYNDPTPRIIEVMEHGHTRIFLGDARVAMGELVRIPSTGGTLRVRELYGQREALCEALDTRSGAPTSTPIEPSGEQAALPCPTGHTYMMREMQYVSRTEETLPVHVELPEFVHLDGARELLETGIDALDVLSPLSRGGVNLVIDATPGKRGFEGLRERVERALGEHVSHMTVHTDPHTPDEVRTVVPADASRDAFYMALKVAASWATRRRDEGCEQLFFAELPVISSHEAWQHYNASLGKRSGREMSYGEVISWVGAHFTSTHTAKVTTLLTLTMPGAEGDLGDIIDTMGLGDVDAVIVIDEQGCYAPQRSRSRTQQPAQDAAEAMRVRGMLHRADQIAQKIALFGDDELPPEEIAAHDEAGPWRPVVD